MFSKAKHRSASNEFFDLTGYAAPGALDYLNQQAGYWGSVAAVSPFSETMTGNPNETDPTKLKIRATQIAWINASSGCDPETDDTCRMDLILGTAGRWADQELRQDVKDMAINAAFVGVGSVVADVTRGLLESILFGRVNNAGEGFKGLLNDNKWLRGGAGWKKTTGENVFRVSGKLVGGAHFLDIPWH